MDFHLLFAVDNQILSVGSATRLTTSLNIPQAVESNDQHGRFELGPDTHRVEVQELIAAIVSR